MQEDNIKIALFTCHNDPNFGSMLQAYALVAAIKRLGKNAEYISYIAANAPRNKFIRLLSGFKKKVFSLFGAKQQASEFDFLNSPEFSSTMKAYRRFHDKYIPCSEKIYYADTIKKQLNIDEYSIYMVGSDQSWSPNLYRPTKPYFLDIANFKNKCAYAPSLGTTVLSDEYRHFLKKKLMSFDYLSCRELVNSKMLSNLLGRPVQHVLDPTLLLTAKNWDDVATAPAIKGKYILAYILGEKDVIVNFAECLSKENAIPVYYIVTRPKYLNKDNALTGVGPDDFVGLIKNASCVITDSYHGCLFSINYNVNFYAFGKREGTVNTLDNVRIVEMLTMLGIQNRFLSDDTIFSKDEDIDYANVNIIVNSMRTKSLEYLSKCIEND